MLCQCYGGIFQLVVCVFVCVCVWFAVANHIHNRLEYAAITLATHISTSTVRPYL